MFRKDEKSWKARNGTCAVQTKETRPERNAASEEDRARDPRADALQLERKSEWKKSRSELRFWQVRNNSFLRPIMRRRFLTLIVALFLKLNKSETLKNIS